MVLVAKAISQLNIDDLRMRKNLNNASSLHVFRYFANSIVRRIGDYS